MITFRKIDKIIAGTVDGKPFNVANTEENVAQMEQFQKDNASIEEVLAFVKAARSQEIAGSNQYLVYNPATQEYFLKFDGFRSKQAIPAGLVKFIEDSYGKEIDFMPVIKAWARLLTNPRYTPAMGEYFDAYISSKFTDTEDRDALIEEGYTDEAATALATYSDIAITQEGLLATYKVAEIVTWEWIMKLGEDGVTYEKVRNPKYKTIPATLDPTTGDELTAQSWERPEFKEDFVFTPAICKSGDKFYSGNRIGYVYEVGKVQRLPKKAIRNLQNTFGGGGLYIGGLAYIANYRHFGTHVLTCFVNPGDILSFQSEGAAIRVDALMPNNVWDEDVKLKSVYHSSDYDKMSTKRLDAIIADAVHRDVKLIDEQEDINDQRYTGEVELLDGETEEAND